MRFRTVVLLALVGSLVSLVQFAVWFFARAKATWQSEGNLVFDLLASLMLVVFLCFLYCEASEWIQPRARAITAVGLLIFTVLSAAGKILGLALRIVALRQYHNLSTSDLLIQVFDLLQTFVWILFLMAFSSKRVTATTRLVPTISGVLALFNLGFAGWSSVQLYKGFAVAPPLAIVPWNYVTVVFGWGTLVLFYVEIWRRWKRDWPIQQNIVC